MTLIFLIIGLVIFIYSFVYKDKAIMRIQNNQMKGAKPHEKKESRLALVMCMFGCAIFMIGLMPLLIKSKPNVPTDSTSSSSNTPNLNTAAENKSSFGNKLTSNVYESDENGLKTYLKFEGSEGSQGMFGSLTLSNNASTCKYVYTYNISGSNIKANFHGSDCGGNSSDQSFIYNERENSISCNINGQRFIFKSIY